MKTIKNSFGILSMVVMLLFSACGKDGNQTGESKSGSDSQTTPNDSSGAESRKAIGVGEDDQNENPGFQSTQNNLNADSTRSRHDVDTTQGAASQPR